MNWSEQAEEMMKSWADAQKTVWTGWYEMSKNAPGAQGANAAMPDLSALFKPGLDAWTKGTGPTPENLADQVINSQHGMMKTLEMLTKSWAVVMPHVEKGTDWQSDFKAFADDWTKKTFGAPQSLGEASADMSELWSSFLGEWGPMLKPWLMSANQMVNGYLGDGLFTGGLGLDRLMAFDKSALPHLFNMNPETDMAFHRLAEIPRIGSNREQVAALLSAFDAFVDFRKAVIKYRALVAEAMRDAVEKTMDRLAKLSAEGESITSVRELNRLWVEVADESFTQSYSSNEYAETMRELSSSGMRYKIEQRKVVEMVLKAFDIPTRSELDDAYRSLYELRKDVKSMKKALAAAQREPQAKAPRVTRRAAIKKAAPAKNARKKAPAGTAKRPRKTNTTSA